MHGATEIAVEEEILAVVKEVGAIKPTEVCTRLAEHHSEYDVRDALARMYDRGCLCLGTDLLLRVWT